MRLLDTTTLELHEFFDSQIPQYAILSHRWKDGEVTFKDLTKKRNLDAPGWIKIRKACKVALKRNQKWIWIDTCCIDKKSSAELSEALNSMYRWYKEANECYAYLNDVVCEKKDLQGLTVQPWFKDMSRLLGERGERAFRSSEWFTRGWTLQELIAPRLLLFIDKQWTGVLGSRAQLSGPISDITGIGISYLQGHHVESVSVATRMSWASRRLCSRAEDVAYCLLGIFDVSMPLLYGEGGQSAFRRLQLEIMKDSSDESIFAWDPRFHPDWKLVEPFVDSNTYCPMLASTPSLFSGSSAVQDLSSEMRVDRRWRPRAPFSMTNRGLVIRAVLGECADNQDVFLMPLYCFDADEDSESVSPLAIFLRQTGPQEYVRVVGTVAEEDSLAGLLHCPEELVDHQNRCFKGDEESIIVTGQRFPTFQG